MSFPRYKKYSSPLYNYLFDRITGKFARWGKTKDDDPKYSIIGPEIADIEISTTCSKGCAYCYKSNTVNGTYMTNESYKRVLNIINQNDTLTQVALGIGDIDANLDLEKILITTREFGLVPNITINGSKMTDYYYDMLAKYCGAVSISRYNDEELIETAKELKKRIEKNDNTLKYINIHMILCKDTYDDLFDFIKNKFESVKDLFNAIVFLSLKPLGDRNKYTSGNDYNSNDKQEYRISKEEYKTLIDYALSKRIPIGFDSCWCYNFLESIKDSDKYKQLSTYAEPCESTLFSIYVNVFGKAFPCSFCEHSLKFMNIITKDYKFDDNYNNITFPDLLSEKDIDFLMDVWFSPMFNRFRKLVLNTACNELNCRRCPIFDI